MRGWTRRKGPAGRDHLSGYLDEGAHIEGKFAFSGTVMLNGRFTGEIESGDTLVVGERAMVRAAIRAGAVVVSGEVVGNVVATERVELRGTARVTGDIEAPVVVVDEGARFEGQCRMGRAPAQPPVSHDGSVVPLRR